VCVSSNALFRQTPWNASIENSHLSRTLSSSSNSGSAGNMGRYPCSRNASLTASCMVSDSVPSGTSIHPLTQARTGMLWTSIFMPSKLATVLVKSRLDKSTTVLTLPAMAKATALNTLVDVPIAGYDYSKQIEVVKALRGAFDKVKHHKEWSKRLLKTFKEALPGYALSMGVAEHGSLNTLRVWGNGLHYENDCVYVCFSIHENGKERSWQDGFMWALNRADHSDYAERQEQERALYPQLDDIAARIAELQNEAHAMIEDLPMPKSATIRGEVHWKNASHALQAKYPEIWPKS
jgi:hypothetical protein